jgi:hypothetical protein
MYVDYKYEEIGIDSKEVNWGGDGTPFLRSTKTARCEMRPAHLVFGGKQQDAK